MSSLPLKYFSSIILLSCFINCTFNFCNEFCFLLLEQVLTLTYTLPGYFKLRIWVFIKILHIDFLSKKINLPPTETCGSQGCVYDALLGLFFFLVKLQQGQTTNMKWVHSYYSNCNEHGEWYIQFMPLTPEAPLGKNLIYFSLKFSHRKSQGTG